MLIHRRRIVKSLCCLPALSWWLPARPAAGTSHDKPDPEPQGPGAAGNILVIGDSLSAEYGLERGTGWVANIAQRLDEHATGYQIHNSSIGGDTSSGGLSRLPGALQRQPAEIVVIELGSNDALRGLSLDMTRANLARMIELAQAAGAHVVLVGMQIPPNYGKPYAEQFAQLFPALSRQYNTTLVPFLLEGFATKRDLFQDDAIHPNETGQRIMADTMWEALAPLLAPASK